MIVRGKLVQCVEPGAFSSISCTYDDDRYICTIYECQINKFTNHIQMPVPFVQS